MKMAVQGGEIRGQAGVKGAVKDLLLKRIKNGVQEREHSGKNGKQNWNKSMTMQGDVKVWSLEAGVKVEGNKDIKLSVKRTSRWTFGNCVKEGEKLSKKFVKESGTGGLLGRISKRGIIQLKKLVKSWLIQGRGTKGRKSLATKSSMVPIMIFYHGSKGGVKVWLIW